MDDLILTHTITSYECSADHLMKPEFFLHLCQEMAEEHADLYNLGFGWAVQNHKIWVETQGNYEFFRRPAWKETISLRTNTGQASALQARRFVEMTDKEGNVLARADLLWVLIDITTRRPFPLKRANTPIQHLECPPITAELVCPEWSESPAACVAHTASRRDIDFNGHINNSAYLVWALDTLPDALTLEGSPTRIHLAFRKECMLNAEVEIQHYRSGNYTHHVINSTEGVRAEVDILWA
jgi:acyl-ACP thioesterase